MRICEISKKFGKSVGSFLYIRLGGVRVASSFVTLLQKPYLSIIIWCDI